jgi:hypothetical protein
MLAKRIGPAASPSPGNTHIAPASASTLIVFLIRIFHPHRL